MHRIEHVIVPMLENRSFDNMLGQLYPRSECFDGLDLTESNHGTVRTAHKSGSIAPPPVNPVTGCCCTAAITIRVHRNSLPRVQIPLSRPAAPCRRGRFRPAH